MAGKLCFGKEYANAGAGKHDNPHQDGSEAFIAFDAGYDGIAHHEPKGCCAI